MKITVIGINYAPELTGIAVYTSALSEALAARGEQVQVITGYPHYPQWRVYDGYKGFSRREQLTGVDVRRHRHYVPAHPALANRLMMEITFGLRAVFSRWGRPEIVMMVTPALFATGLAALRARLTGTKTCIWVQDIYSLGVSESGMGGRLASRILRWAERVILNSAGSVVVIHDRFKRYLVEELGIAAHRVEVVGNWSHLVQEPPASRPEVRLMRGWRPEDIIVLHAGNMGAKQGLENVIQASELAARQKSRVRFVLVGDGNQREALAAMGGNSHLELHAPLPEDKFTAVLAAADILLVNERPGLTEMSVPSKLTSYFSTGLPVIAATDAASVTAEELARSGAGLRVDTAAPAALLRAAEALGTNPERAAALGSAGRAYQGRHLSGESAVARFLEILRPPMQSGDKAHRSVRTVRNATGGPAL